MPLPSFELGAAQKLRVSIPAYEVRVLSVNHFLALDIPPGRTSHLDRHKNWFLRSWL
jgi:hypothetical protein